MTNEELIAQARRFDGMAADNRNYTYGLIQRLANALEAATPATTEWGVRLKGAAGDVIRCASESVARSFVAEGIRQYRFHHEVVSRQTNNGAWETEPESETSK